MGIYLNPQNIEFYNAVNYSGIYVDKSELIEFTNSVLFGAHRNVCVSRPRRFGKSMAANMLVAYYSKGCDSRELFQNLKISKAESFEKHLNKYDVIHLNIQQFLGESSSVNEMISFIEEDLLEELTENFSDIHFPKRLTLMKAFAAIFNKTKIPFIFIIDEWDCVFRVKKNDSEAQKKYLDFFRGLLKDQPYSAFAYMTGILPIKKYGEHSALNMFDEYSMTNQRVLAEFTGFTEAEVKELCSQYDMDFSETKRWYDGYHLKGVSIYNPRSVVMSMTGHDFDNYWTSTETYEALKIYIQMNFDGLQDTIVRLLAGEKYEINTETFTNDMVTFQTRDDVLTLLIHLGYLTYDFNTKTAAIPNYEISEQFASTIKILGWSEVVQSIKLSDELLKATLDLDSEKVAKLISKSHMENSSILKYNDENSLACVISLAYYSVRSKYIIHRELPTGKGFADIVYIPRQNIALPALVIELKHNQPAETAIEQIKSKNYTEKIKEYSGEILLVGISYDDNKGHSCVIEKICK